MSSLQRQFCCSSLSINIYLKLFHFNEMSCFKYRVSVVIHLNSSPLLPVSLMSCPFPAIILALYFVSCCLFACLFEKGAHIARSDLKYWGHRHVPPCSASVSDFSHHIPQKNYFSRLHSSFPPWTCVLHPPPPLRSEEASYFPCQELIILMLKVKSPERQILLLDTICISSCSFPTSFLPFLKSK